MAEFETGSTELFKFVNFFHHGDSIQFWSDDSINRLRHIKKVLTNVSSFEMISPTAVHLMKELVGDSTSYLSVITYHDILINKKLEVLAMVEVLKSESVTSNEIKAMFELDTSDAVFRAFHDRIDDKCKEALDACYGQFSELRTPILTQVNYSFTYMFDFYKTLS